MMDTFIRSDPTCPHALDDMAARAFHMAADRASRTFGILSLDTGDQFTMFFQHIGLAAERRWKTTADRP